MQRLAQPRGEHGDAVLSPLPSRTTISRALEVDILDPQPQRLQQPQAAAVEQPRHQRVHAVELRQHGAHLVAE